MLEDPPIPAVDMADFAVVVAQNLLGDAEVVARDPAACLGSAGPWTSPPRSWPPDLCRTSSRREA